MSRYKAYPEYKDSEAIWLGEIPADWNLYEGKRLFSSRREAAREDDEQLAASQKYGVIPQNVMMELNDAKVMLALKGTNSFRHVDKNNFVISLRSFEGGIEHSSYVGCVSPAYTVLRSEKDIAPGYFKYLLKSAPYIAALQASTDSLRDGKSISYEQFGAIPLPYPQPETQSVIASFLDHETAKIDALIEKQQRLIELLKEKRQAVISHAVTKGLNPKAPMKDPGVKWLGEVPAHWVVSKVKHFATMQGGYAFNSELFKEDGVQILRIGNVYLNELSLERQPVFVDEYFLKTHRNFVVGLGDLLMSLTGTLGKTDYGFAVRVDKAGPFMLNQRVAKITPKESKISVSYLLYSVRSESYLKQLHSLPSGTKQANLSNEDVLNISIAVPSSIEEQNIISSYIAEQLSKYDSIIANSLSAIELLQERRTALISAAVTGKIDVRDWQAAA